MTETTEAFDTAKTKRDLADALDGTYSSLREKMLEHAFLTELARALWRSGRRDFEFLRAEVDRGGYDVAVECDGVLRHIQLKSRHRAGKATEVSLALALADKPSGCAVWIDYDPLTLEIGPFLWFGGAPGEKLPALGDKVTRHSKGNKQERPAHRTIKRTGFRRIETIDELAVTLFGPVRRRLRAPEDRLADLAALAGARSPGERLTDLAALAGGFRMQEAADGSSDDIEFIIPEPDPETGIIHGLGYYRYSGLIDRFMDLAIADWMIEEAALLEAKGTVDALRADPATIASASEDDLAALLTTLVREERFTDGTFAEAARNGIVLAICERAEALRRGAGGR